MTRRLCCSLLVIAAIAGCARKGARAADFDSAATAALAPPPGTPSNGATTPEVRASSFDIGHDLDRNNNLVGGPGGQFSTGDTLAVSVQLQYAHRGDVVSARIINNHHTVDSATVTAPLPDSTQVTMLGLHFIPVKRWPRGQYQLEVFVGANSQGLKDFTIGQQ